MVIPFLLKYLKASGDGGGDKDFVLILFFFLLPYFRSGSSLSCCCVEPKTNCIVNSAALHVNRPYERVQASQCHVYYLNYYRRMGWKYYSSIMLADVY